jgi:hypothetical protein
MSRLRRCAGSAHRDRRGREGPRPRPAGASAAHIPWRRVAAMRDQLAHRYFDTSHTIVQHTIEADPCPSSQRRCRPCWTGPRGPPDPAADKRHAGQLQHLCAGRRLSPPLPVIVRRRGARCAIGDRTAGCAAGPVPDRERPGGVARGELAQARARGQVPLTRPSRGGVDGPSTCPSRAGAPASSAQLRPPIQLVGRTRP